MAQYNDLFMRDAMDDTGQTPSGVRTAYLSPDIIPWGPTIHQDPQQYFREYYSQDVGRNLIDQEANYIYVRCKNLYNQRRSGRIYLNYSRSTFLEQPSVWRNNVLRPSLAQDFVTIEAQSKDEVVVGSGAFQWTPLPLQQAHYCLIARIVTDSNPNLIPDTFRSTEDFITWILNNPGIAWRNVSLLSNSAPPQWQVSNTFANFDVQNQLYAFTATATKSFPVGTRMSLTCSDSGPMPLINYSATSEGQDPWYLYTQAVLPPNFQSSVLITVRLPSGTTWPQGGQILFTYSRMVGSNDPELLQRVAVTPKQFGLPNHIGTDIQGTMIRMGSYLLSIK